MFPASVSMNFGTKFNFQKTGPIGHYQYNFNSLGYFTIIF